MTDLITMLTRANTGFTGADEDARLYTEPEIRKHATHVIELLPPAAPDSRGDRYPGGLLAVLEDDGAVSLVVLRFHSGTSRDGNRVDVYPPVYEVLFSGTGFGAPLRELRHTDWGEAGYIHYPDGPVIAEAFRELGQWFDDCAPPEPCADNKHDLPSTDVGTRCPCGRVVVCDDGVRIDGRRGELAGLSPVRSPGVISTTWTFAPKEPT